MRAATEIIHGSQGVNRDADPLTTPIYETTTFLFDNAEEVKAYNEGRSARFLYSRYSNPTVVAVEKTIAALEGADTALLLPSGMATRSSAARPSTAARCTCSRISSRTTASRRASRRSTS